MEKEKKPLKLTDGGMASYFAGMASQYNPNAVPGLEAVIQFKLEEINENFYLLIENDNCIAYKGAHPSPTVTILTPADIWMKISTGELSGAKAFMKKMFKVEGDMGLLLKMSSLFSDSTTSEQVIQISAEKFEHIPEQRGPLKIPGLMWLNIAFIPWIVLWIWSSISPGLLPQLVAAVISIIITLYHLITNRPTLFEKGTCIYLIIAAFLFGIQSEFFMIYFKVINYIFLGGLWLISLVKIFSLTAEYSRHGYPKAIWGTRAFLETNNILTALWGIYFLCSAIMNLIVLVNAELSIILMILSYLLLIPMFAFTSWFQKWYPAKLNVR